MTQLVLVGLGGCVGALSRYKLGGLILHHTESWKFPLSTFVINITGCLIAGVLSGLVEKHDFLTADQRLFLFTGILGGFTTFSAFGLETVLLFQRNEPGLAFLNAGLSVLCGVTALWIGIKLIP